MKKIKKMADGGLLGLIGGDVKQTPLTPPVPVPGLGGVGGGGTAQQGLQQIGQGSETIGSALGRASQAIGGGGVGVGGGVGGNSIYYKKGGKVTTSRRISTGQRSKKSSNW